MVCEVVGSPGNPPTSAALPAWCSPERGSPTTGWFCESTPTAEEREKKMGGNNKKREKRGYNTLGKVRRRQNEIKEVERKMIMRLGFEYDIYCFLL